MEWTMDKDEKTQKRGKLQKKNIKDLWIFLMYAGIFFFLFLKNSLWFVFFFLQFFSFLIDFVVFFVLCVSCYLELCVLFVDCFLLCCRFCKKRKRRKRNGRGSPLWPYARTQTSITRKVSFFFVRSFLPPLPMNDINVTMLLYNVL